MAKRRVRARARFEPEQPPAYPIGSEAWWHSLRGVGVQREAVQTLLPPGKIDGHALPDAGGPAERTALLFLAFDRAPAYAVLMYVPHQWSTSSALREWIVAQYVGVLVHGGPEHVKHALYSLWVDFFEVPRRAAFVYPRLARALPSDKFAPVLAHSGPVPWATKRASYERAAADVTQHAALAEGILGSFYDVYGSVVPLQARALVRAIQVHDDRVRDALVQVLGVPARWHVVALVTVDETDARWTRWISERLAPCSAWRGRWRGWQRPSARRSPRIRRGFTTPECEGAFVPGGAAIAD